MFILVYYLLYLFKFCIILDVVVCIDIFCIGINDVFNFLWCKIKIK